jgi:hypothetical protein
MRGCLNCWGSELCAALHALFGEEPLFELRADRQLMLSVVPNINFTHLDAGFWANQLRDGLCLEPLFMGNWHVYTSLVMKLFDADIERLCDLFQFFGRRGRLPVFNQAHIASIDARLSGKPFLAPSAGLPEVLDI